MNILSIETSCDETAVSVVEALGDFPTAKYEILGNALFSQVDIHREYGGVFPAIAKREHAATLVPMLEKALQEAKLPEAPHTGLWPEQKEKLGKILEREPGLFEQVLSFYERYNTPTIGLIAVTAGPGLEPALWVGVNFAKALSNIWNVPVVAVNHMEGHVLASLVAKRAEERKNGVAASPQHAAEQRGNGDSTFHLHQIEFPAIGLLISGGHTELIKMSNYSIYEKIGETRDDAVGEAFDKVARLLGLPYPGGPQISALAEIARKNADLTQNHAEVFKLPRPMINSDNLDFSFSGLKTAVLYAIRGKELNEKDRAALAREFEDAAAEVLLKKAEKAVNKFDAKTLILGGGVTANKHIRNTFEKFFRTEYPELKLHIPDPKLSTDNSVMIALAGHARVDSALTPSEAEATIKADGNRSLPEEGLN